MTVGASAQTAWDRLSAPWQAAFDEAWTSWCHGCFGIGAVAVDETGDIVARGRNRVLEPKSEPGVLADTITAHAEMNVLAALSWGRTDVELYTTLEPCLMCASSIAMAQVPVVHFAAADPLFAGVDDLIRQHPYNDDRQHTRHGPMDGAVARFANLLPLTFVAFWLGADSPAMRGAVDADPVLAELALELIGGDVLISVRDGGGSAVDAMASVWDELA